MAKRWDSGVLLEIVDGEASREASPPGGQHVPGAHQPRLGLSDGERKGTCCKGHIFPSFPWSPAC